MGIGGSGISAVGSLAKLEGFEVSGCDLDLESAYLGKIKELNIPVFKGHDKKHLENSDLLVISPAVFYQNSRHSEFKVAKQKDKLITWQSFLGKFILKDKKVIAISGTHGKGSTTAIASLIFEKAGLDPSVLLGAKVKKWNSNFRLGRSGLFIVEADEFNDNFLNYSPEIAIIGNIEFDHPDYFSSEREVLKSFRGFVKRLKGDRILIVNQDSPGIKKLFKMLGSYANNLKVYGYTFSEKPKLKLNNSVRIKVKKLGKDGTEFSIKSSQLRLDDTLKINLTGEYNVANAAASIILANLFDIKNIDIKTVLQSNIGLGRRLDLIGEKGKIKVYDDYAHHPTAIAATLSGLRQKYPKNRIWVVVEPHSYSRTKALLEDYRRVFNNSEKVIIGPIFKARDKRNFGMSGDDIAEKSEHKDVIYLKKVDKIVENILKDAKADDVIIVMGAGKSFKWAQEILKSL